MNKFQSMCINRFESFFKDLKLSVPPFKSKGINLDYYLTAFNFLDNSFSLEVYEDSVSLFFNKRSFMIEAPSHDNDEELIEYVCEKLRRLLKPNFEVFFLTEDGRKQKRIIQAENEFDLKKSINQDQKIIKIKRIPRTDVNIASKPVIFGTALLLAALFLKVVLNVSVIAKFFFWGSITLGMVFLILGLQNKWRIYKEYI